MSRYTTIGLMKRTRVFIVCVLVVISALMGRLVYIQVISSGHLQLLAGEQWYRDLPLGARRGNIFDRNGVLMVESVPTYSIYVRPVAVKDAGHVARVLSSLLELSYDKVYQRATSRGTSEWLIKMQVERSVALKILAHNLDGVFLSQSYRRSYPLGVVGGQVLGMVSVDNRGQEGLEAFYNQVLSGTDGRIATPSDLRGVPLRDGVEYFFPSTPGKDLHLHVDATIQNILQTALALSLHEQGAQAVGGLVYDIQTGGVVASASAPFFDMNNQPRDNILELLAGMRNMPIVNVFEPGSTFKIFTLAIAIEEGLVSMDETFHCPGFRIIDGERVKCWRTKGHGQQDLATGVRNSCNCVMMDLALRIGVDRYYKYLNRLGIGEKTGVDFFGESAGLVLPKRFVRPVDLARIGFGHAIATSPLQLITAVGAVVGDGILRTPRFVDSIPSAGTRITSPERGRVISTATSAKVRELLFKVVKEGSGRNSAVPGYQIGGKTGTAQTYVDGVIAQGRYISSFVSFIEVEGVARYATFLYVEQPSRNGYYGAIVAAPYVGEIWRGIVDYLRIPPDESLIPPAQSVRPVEVPSVAGLALFEAISRLEAIGLFVKVEGDGLTAIGTFPTAGTILQRGQPVVVRT